MEDPSRPDPFRLAAMALIGLPLDERTAAFCRLLDEWLPAEMERAKASGGAWAMVNRTTAMWAIGAEIGVMTPPTLE